ncbi:MAG TPA: hypothetical protein VK446_05120 [Methylocystis sp.]|nr:hypothetical protein [Methylocystis sp.]
MGEPREVDDPNSEEAAAVASFRKKFEEGRRHLSTEMVSEALDLMFPDFACLRCGHKEFIVGSTHDIQTFRPVKRYAPLSRTEIICAKCGMIESHSAIALIAGLLKIPLETE